MAISDYMLCAHCDQKAYYDADTSYQDAYVLALCGECKKRYVITYEPAKGFLKGILEECNHDH